MQQTTYADVILQMPFFSAGAFRVKLFWINEVISISLNEGI